MTAAVRARPPDQHADAVDELLRRTRTERGLPLAITDRKVIDRVAAIVTAGRNAA